MPLLVTDYSWKQTESMICISVPLKGVKVGKVDIMCTDEYLKVHFPPYLFEAFLFQPVDDRGTAKVGNGVVLISLPKKSKNLWEHLMITTYNKEKQKEVRERALVKYQERLSTESKAKAQKKQAERKYALETMMKLEQEERDGIQKMKDTYREKTNAELEAWLVRQKKGAAEETQCQIQSQRENPNTLESMTEKQDSGFSDRGKARQYHGGYGDTMIKRELGELPSPRLAGNIPVRFTARVFPTALRESRVQEEDEWLRKQAEARQEVSTDIDELKNLTEKEHDADWLKEKGDKCFAAGDYLSAVNAYNLAVRLNRKIPALYSNRAACHLKLRNLHKAIEDSSQALDLLTPAVAANAAARTRAHVRRGSAFCQLQLYAEGLQDYQAALKIDPHNEALLADTQKIRHTIQGTAANLETQ